MKNYTHELALKLTKVLERKQKYSTEKRTVITYGIELILNSTLKASIYIIVGLFCGKLQEVLIVIFVFGCIRSIAGGIHAKEDTGCFLLTGFIIFCAVSSPHILGKIPIIYKWLPYVTNIIYFVYAPYDEYYQERKKTKTWIDAKIKAMLIMNTFLVISIHLNSYWKAVVMITILAEGMTLIRRIDVEK